MITAGDLWVVCEGTDHSHLELLGKGRTLADAGGRKVIALLCGEGISPVPCFYAGADEAVLLKLPGQDPCQAATAAAAILKKRKPNMVLFPATVRGRMMSAWVAARLDTGLTADCTELSLTEEGLLLQKRPAFGGSLTAEILCRKKRPQMASVRPKVFEIPAPDQTRRGPVHCEQWTGRSYLDLISQHCLQEEEASLAQAKVVVAGGKGIGGKEGFVKLRMLAELLGGAVGASRSAVDAGYAGYGHQIGQTGLTVRPRLYIAVGISGLVQHVVGMNGATTVIAINKDRRAPIFSYADYGIVGHWEDRVDEMIAGLKKEENP